MLALIRARSPKRGAATPPEPESCPSVTGRALQPCGGRRRTHRDHRHAGEEAADGEHDERRPPGAAGSPADDVDRGQQRHRGPPERNQGDAGSGPPNCGCPTWTRRPVAGGTKTAIATSKTRLASTTAVAAHRHGTTRTARTTMDALSRGASGGKRAILSTRRSIISSRSRALTLRRMQTLNAAPNAATAPPRPRPQPHAPP